MRKLHTQMLVNDFRVQIGRESLGGDASAIHDVKIVAELAHEIQILLDEHDGHVRAR